MCFSTAGTSKSIFEGSNRSSSKTNVTDVFLDGMGAELAGEDVEDLLADPAALGERREREVVRVHLAQTCFGFARKQTNKQTNNEETRH